MDKDRFIEIMGDEDIECELMGLEQDNTLYGLNIIAKYLPKSGIGGAEHDIVYSDADIEALVNAGITEKDVKKLNSINWMYESEYDSLSCFV